MTLPSGITNGYSAKENDGRGRRKRLLCKVLVWVALTLSVYQVLWKYYLAGVNIPDVEIDKVTGQKRIRRRPDKLKKRDHEQGKDVPTSPFDGIMEGYLSLINLRVPQTGLKSTDTEKYSGVQATFCHLTWNLQARDPSKVPMFKDLKTQSPLCSGTLFSVDLYDITHKARAYDLRNHTFAATEPKRGQGAWKPTAVVFHETRCGSTLIANIMAAFDPSRTRVYSESPPPVAAIKACENNVPCDPGAQEALIQDVFYMMGRTTRPKTPQYVFYKIQSVGVQSIEAFARAMPKTPWMFAYRDSIEVMMSHFKNYQQGNPLSKDFMPVCLRNYGSKTQHPLLQEIAKSHGRTIESLGKEEYCAAHLASLAESAIREYERTKDSDTKHWFINYKELPHVLWESILPELVLPFTAAQIERMHQVSHSYSKGRGPRAGQHWHEDSTLKQGTAPDSVKQAVAAFLEPSYQKMEAIRETMEKK